MVLYSLSWLSNEVEIVWNSAGIQMTCHRRKVMSLKPEMGKFGDAEVFSKTLTPRSLEFPAASVTLCSLAQRKRMFAAGGGSRLGEALRLEASTNWAQSYDNSSGIWLEKNIWDLFSDGLRVSEKLGDTQKISNKNNVFVAKVIINQWIRGYPMFIPDVFRCKMWSPNPESPHLVKTSGLNMHHWGI